MTQERTIPVLPCASLPTTLAFYRLLGFDVTHEQTRPNPYAATRRGDLHLHFMGIKGLDPAAAFSTCLLLVPEVEHLHETFAGALRQQYGKLPLAGLPRITRMKPGQSRFTVVDVAGNSLIFIKHDAPEEDGDAAVKSETRLGRARRLAARLRDFKNDDAAAARVLDTALSHPESGAALERAQTLAARIELAIALDDPARARTLRAEVDALPLSAAERAQIQPELDRASALEQSQR